MNRKSRISLSICLLAILTLSAPVLADSGTGNGNMPDQIMDYQELAAYQATLMDRVAQPNIVAREPFDQIADLQDLATYQASLGDTIALPSEPAMATGEPFDQITNLQDLATYQASLGDMPQGQPDEDLAVSPDN